MRYFSYSPKALTFLLTITVSLASIESKATDNRLLNSEQRYDSSRYSIKIEDLKTEYTATPLGVDVAAPRFSWRMSTNERGARQTAYRLVVLDEEGIEVWNTGKMKSGHSLGIRYDGAALSPRTRYRWKLTVWDQKQHPHSAESWFETGLMEQEKVYSAWNNAKWIGLSDEQQVLHAQYLPVFRLEFSIQLDKNTNSTKAGFLYGANDARLMDKNKNHQGLSNPKDSSYVMVELDIAPLLKDALALVKIYRVGYSKKDQKEKPLFSFQVPEKLLNRQNLYQVHHFHVSSVLGDTELFLNGTASANRLGRVNLNPLGGGGDFIAFPVLADVGLYVPAGQSAYFSDIAVRHYRGPSNKFFADDPSKEQERLFQSEDKVFSVKDNAYKVHAGVADFFLSSDPSRHSAPMLRTTFGVKSTPVKKARLYISARGIYDVHLNGKRVDEAYLNPGLTQYNKIQHYQVFDVTENLQAGKNALGAVLSEGWWSGATTYMGAFWNFFGDRQSLLAQLIITYADGTEEVVKTDPGSWRGFSDGPMVYGSLFQGEVYDARKEALIENWSNPGYDDSRWKMAVEVPLAGNTSNDAINLAHNMPMVNDYIAFRLESAPGLAVKKVRTLSAVAMEEVRPGVYVYDLSQNIAGVPRITLSGMSPGTKVTLRFAEVKYPSLPEYKNNTGMIMLENIRAAMAQDIYISKGGVETINPRFTYHGFRYIEITGIPRALPLNAVQGDVLSSIHTIASGFETSDTLVNRLWKNIEWSALGNFISIPTDCPQRNERLGWSGDISVFSRTATYLADIPAFLRNHMRAMREVQNEQGRFPDVAPLGGGFGGVLWGSAGITVAWESYRQYGDMDLLRDHYAAMKAYIVYLESQIDPVTKVLCEKERNNWGSLGDWLSPEYDRTEKSLLWEAYFIYDLEVVEKIAAILGKKEDATFFNRRHMERKDFFNKTYIDSTTGTTHFRGKPVDTQASYALPLSFNIFNESNRPLAISSFARSVARENKAGDGTICPPYSLMTGFIGTAWLNHALSESKKNDLAYRLLLQEQYPSWLYPVAQGATTIWERLNAYTHTHGFGGNNTMNSFNHYSFGAVGAWLCEYALGIQRDDTVPGFKQFTLAPEPDPTGKLTYAKGHYDSYYGRIESGWTMKENSCTYTITVPPNTMAKLCINAASADKIRLDGKILRNNKLVVFTGKEQGKCCFSVQPGRYVFEVVQ
ncbi:alpha-L-rhamnosidase [Parasegetibacter sp. NRK P23]|uniref:alpha-L-rhamnosidase n=1 Tax=Parasegetibacter sp. NRK P23 TaxID=2942999 RepID=UPI002044AE65|nr:alpha-L-rhamnosidase [Parasegetibacter sp. NRK P23]MCM5528420.1 glycoside hydrolase family 78 protein [Parasegetibacter sp. NRK P23]